MNDLEKYKFLCEKRIKQFDINHPLPLTEEIMLNYNIKNDYFNLIKKTIEDDLIKNNVINQYINSENVIDLAKIKIECDEYRKQIVLMKSMINNLQSDFDEVCKENENLKKNNFCENNNDNLKEDFNNLLIENEKLKNKNNNNNNIKSGLKINKLKFNKK